MSCLPNDEYELDDEFFEEGALEYDDYPDDDYLDDDWGQMMRSTTDVIREWHEEGQKQKASHLIVLRDRLDGSLSPLYARHEDDTKEIVRDYSREENERFVSVDSVFKLNKSLEEQEDLFNY